MPPGILSYYSESVETTKGAIEVMRMSLPAVDVLEIAVRRNFLLLDALREGRKKKFVPTKQLKVRIILICSSSFTYTH